MAEKKTVEEVKVAAEKVAAFQKFLDENQITGFNMEDLGGEAHRHAFRSNLPVAGQQLPFWIVLDDSVYTMIQIQIVGAIAVADKRERICGFLNDLNEQYQVLKYSADAQGNVILSCCIPAGVPHFDPALVIAILNQIQTNLNEIYSELMQQLWAK
jgi:hypothetical protein